MTLCVWFVLGPRSHNTQECAIFYSTTLFYGCWWCWAEFHLAAWHTITCVCIYLLDVFWFQIAHHIYEIYKYKYTRARARLCGKCLFDSHTMAIGSVLYIYIIFRCCCCFLWLGLGKIRFEWKKWSEVKCGQIKYAEHCEWHKHAWWPNKFYCRVSFAEHKWPNWTNEWQ